MNKEKLKYISVYSIILGAAMGLVALVPYINFIPVVIMSVFSSCIIIFYMQKKKQIGNLTIKGGAILGALIGVVALIGFLTTFLPIAGLLGAIFNKSTLFVSYRFLWQIWWVLLLMGSIITALFNSFGLMAYVYVRDTFFMIEGKKDDFQINYVRNGDKNEF